jgi:hypothetical protein
VLQGLVIGLIIGVVIFGGLRIYERRKTGTWRRR